jgi:hypothetical protein
VNRSREGVSLKIAFRCSLENSCSESPSSDGCLLSFTTGATRSKECGSSSSNGERRSSSSRGFCCSGPSAWVAIEGADDSYEMTESFELRIVTGPGLRMREGGRDGILYACADGVREELRIGNCMASGVLGILKDVSELRRRCIEMRFLFAAGVFELAAISHEICQLFFTAPTLFSRECVCLSW